MEKQIYRLWGVIQPLVILAILLSAFVISGILWNVQQHNVNLLHGKIVSFNQDIEQASSNNELFKLEDRLKLKKDVLVLEKDATMLQNGVYPPLVQVIGGAILSITAYVGYCNFKVGEENLKIGQKNLKVTEDKQVTERFSKAIEHLGSDKIDIRLGGIYALEQIAIDSVKYHWTIVEILSAFIREKRPLDSTDQVGVDLQAALTVIGRRKVEQDPKSKYINLRKVNLVGVESQSTNFSGINFSGADLSGAQFSDVNFSSVNLNGVDLSGAYFKDVNLSSANLRGADLNRTSFWRADMNGAIFTDIFDDNVNLTNTNLSTCVNLTREQLELDSAITNENTYLPQYLRPIISNLPF
jgi:hypothetical protein